tara:strand:- start:1737 stop:2201 length:465 start_codon:yes stop_codon:yes gene_type:complete
MEFIIFLSKIDKDIVELIKKANYSIEENTSLCLIDKKFMGFHKKIDRSIVICTKNAKEMGNYKKNKPLGNSDNHKTHLYLKRALRHEATHIAQSCNDDKILGDIKNIEKKINKTKLKALESSVKISGNHLKEVEAYILEDKPKEVKKAIEKYCL